MNTLKYEFFENNANKLFISFSPADAGGKFLFYSVRKNIISDCLYFNDESNRLYTSNFDEIRKTINDLCDKKIYEEVILVGFSAGGLTACLIGASINFNGKINIHAFSPHISLAAKHSSAAIRVPDLDLSSYDLRNINISNTQLRISLYLSTVSLRDGIHVRDSFFINHPRIRIYYLRTGHDTESIVRSNYPAKVYSLIDDEFFVAQEFLASPTEVMKCLMLIDLGIAEIEERISPLASIAMRVTDYSAEYCHWQARQFVRMGKIDDAIRWGWAAIIKSAPDTPDSFPEALGHAAFDNGRPRDALLAYRRMKNPTVEVLSRIEILRKWDE